VALRKILLASIRVHSRLVFFLRFLCLFAAIQDSPLTFASLRLCVRFFFVFCFAACRADLSAIVRRLPDEGGRLCEGGSIRGLSRPD
jgi:hypothetical protein